MAEGGTGLPERLERHLVLDIVTSRGGIAPARLQSKRFCASNPARPIGTQEGGQANRRVELVKP